MDVDAGRSLKYTFRGVDFDLFKDLDNLLDMPSDVPLTKEEHLQVVNDLAQYMERMTPQEIPVFVYQLLKVCKHQNSKSVFLKLQLYFDLRIYKHKNHNDVDSEGTTVSNFDVIESASEKDTIETESTVLYHIHTSASLGHECIREYVNSLKNMTKSPEFILNPFQLQLLFTISTISHYEETIFEIIRPCIVRYYNEDLKRTNSCWYRETVPASRKIESLFSEVVTNSLQDRDNVLEGLVNFAFVLLGVGSALGRDPISEKQWQLGSMIVLKIIKRKRQAAPVIIQTLTNCIITGHNVTHYIECMYILCKTLPLLMIENQSCVIEMMEALVQIPGSVANQLLDAIVPLVKVSTTFRDHLIILLRKALYSRITETRQMAVIGFIKLLTNLKISNLTALSQSSSQSGSFTSGHSLFTQLSLNRTSQCLPSTFSNEALCLEVLSILKRCFMQQAEVRAQLYEGLYDAVCMNPELGIPILDVIWFHFSKYYVMDEDVIPPLKFDSIVVTRDVDAICQEPLGKLIYAIGLILKRVSQSDSDNTTVVKFQTILDSMCRRMINCELVHLELDDGTDLLDIVPESHQKLLILKEAMNVYEALIGYKVCQWEPESEGCGQQINDLYQGYSRLSQFLKNLTKPKKDGRKKTDNNRTTQVTNTTRKESQKSSKGSKAPDTLLNFHIMGKILKLLHETNVPWTTPAEANVIKIKKELHRHIMQATLCLVHDMKNKKPIDTNYSKLHYDHLTETAEIIYNRIITRFEEFVDFDCSTGILGLECFHAIILLITTQYKSNLANFLRKVGKSEKEGLVENLTGFVTTYQQLFEMNEEDTSDDPDIKKLHLTAINTLTTLCNQIPSDSNPLSLQIIDWLKDYASNNTLTAKISGVFISLLFDCYIKYKVSLSLFENIAVNLGDVFGVIETEESDDEKFKIVNEATAHNIILELCSSIKSILEDIDSVIVRMKSEFLIVTYPGVDDVIKKIEKLKNKEKAVCCQLCFVVTILTNLSNITVQPGTVSEAIFKNVIQLYTILVTLTKHFIGRSSKQNPAFQAARFERLVKLTGKQLTPILYKFILEIEGNQKQATQNTQSKKKNVDSSALKSKVLKETRLIPKVVFEIELFSKNIIQLSTKTKLDLSKYVGHGITRDFRFMQLKEVLEQAGEDVPQTQTTEADTSINEAESDHDESGDIDTSPPPTKKSKQ